jgi:hypothetical protein
MSWLVGEPPPAAVEVVMARPEPTTHPLPRVFDVTAARVLVTGGAGARARALIGG